QWTARRRQGDHASWEVLENWPILDNERVRETPAAFIADDRNPRWMFNEHTSGTTGKPLVLWRTHQTMRSLHALAVARTRAWHGVSRRDRWAMLWGQLVPARDAASVARGRPHRGPGGRPRHRTRCVRRVHLHGAAERRLSADPLPPRRRGATRPVGCLVRLRAHAPRPRRGERPHQRPPPHAGRPGGRLVQSGLVRPARAPGPDRAGGAGPPPRPLRARGGIQRRVAPSHRATGPGARRGRARGARGSPRDRARRARQVPRGGVRPAGRGPRRRGGTAMSQPIRVLMVTSDWPTPGQPRTTYFIKRQAEFLQAAGVLV